MFVSIGLVLISENVLARSMWKMYSENITNFTGKYLHLLFLIKYQPSKNRVQQQVFFFEFCEIFQKSYLSRTPLGKFSWLGIVSCLGIWTSENENVFTQHSHQRTCQDRCLLFRDYVWFASFYSNIHFKHHLNNNNTNYLRFLSTENWEWKVEADRYLSNKNIQIFHCRKYS